MQILTFVFHLIEKEKENQESIELLLSKATNCTGI